MTTLITAIMLTSLLTIIGIGSILFGLRFIINRIAEQEICINIIEAQLKNSLNSHSVTNEEIVHAFDDFIKIEVREDDR